MIAEFGLGLLWLAAAMAGLILVAGGAVLWQDSRHGRGDILQERSRILKSLSEEESRRGALDALAVVVRRASLAQALLAMAAFACLIALFVRSDMSVELVAAHSHSMKPLLYKVAGAWGNHEGSMLLWLTILSLSGGLVACFERRLSIAMHSATLAAQAALALGFYSFLLFSSNPFARLNPPLRDGLGLNPLLQDPGLLFHPPTLYIGYVGLSVAFSFAVGSLLVRADVSCAGSSGGDVSRTNYSGENAPLSQSREGMDLGSDSIRESTVGEESTVGGGVSASDALGRDFARAMRPWVLLSWIFLTLGITAGSYWAYYELGWGGWWFWDPVENVSLIPWLAATALLHSVSVTATRGALHGWTVMLALVGFSMAMLGTFIVRSGLLVSVHSFAIDPERGRFLLLLMGFYIGGGLLLFALRMRRLPVGRPFALLSRESGLTANNLLLIVILLTVLYGTLYPIFAEAMGERISVGPPYFNRVVGPIALTLFLLMTIGPLLRWRRDDWVRVRRWLPLICASGGLVFAVLWVVGAIATSQSPLAIAGLVVAAMVAAGTIAPMWRIQNHSMPRWGMVTAHLGVAVALAGAAAESGFSQEKLVAMAVGDSVEMGGYRFTLRAVQPLAGPNYTAIEGVVAVARAPNIGNVHSDDHEALAFLRPQSRSYPQWNAAVMGSASPRPTTRSATITNEAALLTTLSGQLYVVINSPISSDPLQHYRLRLWWKPLVWWIWLGGVMIALGGLLALVGRAGLPRRLWRGRSSLRLSPPRPVLQTAQDAQK